jgi:hypothetical protein
VYGVLLLVFGILAPIAAGFGSTLPVAFIGVLGGLADARLAKLYGHGHSWD